MTTPPNEQPEPWSPPDSSGHPTPPPDPSHYPPPQQPEPGYYPGGTPGVYDPMSAPPTYTPPFTNPPPSGGNNNAGMIIGAVIGGVCLIAVIGVIAFLAARPDDDGDTAADPQQSPSPSDFLPTTGSASGPPVDPNADIQGDGTYLVGEDIKAGEYATTVPDSSSLCYWERLKGTSGEFDDIIANGVAEPGEKVTVTVKDKDKAFKSQGCGPWTKS